MWRYLILFLLIFSFVKADDVLLFASNETIPLTTFQLFINENPFFITAITPDGTIIDRDSIDPSDPESVMLNVTVPSDIPDGTLIEFRATLITPNGKAGMTNILLGTNTTVNHQAVFSYDPSSTNYAGNWSWYGNSSGGTKENALSFISKGSLYAAFSQANYPEVIYDQNDTAIVRANLTSNGIESSSELNSDYAANMTGRFTHPSSISTTRAMSFTNPYWNTTFTFLDLAGVGIWNSIIEATAQFFYAENSTGRQSTVYGYMNITANSTDPGTIFRFDYATTTCIVSDQHTNNIVEGANVTFYRNGTYLGWNTTNNTGEAQYTFQGISYGTWTITCNITDQTDIYYYHGDEPERNSTLIVTSNAPSFVGDVTDESNDTNPTNEGVNITFTGNATDPELDQWYLLVCDAPGTSSGGCTGTQVCKSTLTDSDTVTTCKHNTTGETNEEYNWFAYACDFTTVCNATANNATAPYTVNHAPTTAPTLDTLTPTVADTITCSANAGDGDAGDTISNVFAWWLQVKGAGGYQIIPGETSNQLADAFASNDNIICQVTPTDSHGFSGNATNSSVATVQQGILSAASSLADASVYRTKTTTISGNCTLTTGDAEAVTLVIQDNRTGSYAQSSTVAAVVYVNQASFSLGTIASQTSATQTATIYTQTAGDYSFRVQCQAGDATPTNANSTPENLEVITDTTPPVISSIDVIEIQADTVTVIWNTDDETDGTVDYGLTTVLGSTTFNPSLTTTHSILLTGLLNGTQYFYNITSCNVDSYCTTIGPNSFTTLSLSDIADQIERGYCTAVLIEQGPNYKEGFISKGDVYEFSCEMPHKVNERQPFSLILTNKNKQVRKQMQAPATIYGNQVVVYP